MQWSLDNIGVVYRLEDGARITALADVSCPFCSGERVAVIGHNGSGKSTLARLLGGVISPTTGRITVDGKGDDAPGTAALILQNPGDNIIGETVREEIELTLGRTYEPSRDADVEMLIAQYGIAELLDRSPSELSGGETQLVALVCGLISGRRMVVLDEPTSHLDPPGRLHLIDYLLRGGSENDPSTDQLPAVLFITQYRDEACRFPRVIELDGGRIVYDGSPNVSSELPSSTPAVDHLAPANRDAPPLIRLNGLSQRDSGEHESCARLTGITTAVREGDAIGVVGPIGSGKTTLAYHLAGLLAPDAGTVEYANGLSATDPPVVLIQFPERQLFAETVLEDVAFGARNRGLADSDATALSRRCLDATGLPSPEFAHRSPFSLSGGQKRRAALASVSACEAKLYILDEPTSALDAEGLSALEDQLRRWRADAVSYAVISHDLDWLCRVTTRVWIMAKGRLIADTTWDDSECAFALEQIGFLA